MPGQSWGPLARHASVTVAGLGCRCPAGHGRLVLEGGPKPGRRVLCVGRRASCDDTGCGKETARRRLGCSSGLVRPMQAGEGCCDAVLLGSFPASTTADLNQHVVGPETSRQEAGGLFTTNGQNAIGLPLGCPHRTHVGNGIEPVNFTHDHVPPGRRLRTCACMAFSSPASLRLSSLTTRSLFSDTSRAACRDAASIQQMPQTEYHLSQ